MARDCLAFIAFCTGETGTPGSRGTIGICASEWLVARNSERGKVRGLDLTGARGRGRRATLPSASATSSLPASCADIEPGSDRWPRS